MERITGRSVQATASNGINITCAAAVYPQYFSGDLEIKHQDHILDFRLIIMVSGAASCFSRSRFLWQRNIIKYKESRRVVCLGRYRFFFPLASEANAPPANTSVCVLGWRCSHAALLFDIMLDQYGIWLGISTLICGDTQRLSQRLHPYAVPLTREAVKLGCIPTSLETVSLSLLSFCASSPHLLSPAVSAHPAEAFLS